MYISWLEKGLKTDRTIKQVEKPSNVFIEKFEEHTKSKLIPPEIRKLNPRVQRIFIDRRQIIVAGQIMSSPVITVIQSRKIEHARSIILEKHFHYIPVVSAHKKLVGIVSDWDLFGRVSKKAYKPNNTNIDSNILKVEHIMVKRVLVAKENTEIPHIARVLIEENIGAIPIIDSKDHPIGIITRSDILRTIIEKVPLDIWA